MNSKLCSKSVSLNRSTATKPTPKLLIIPKLLIFDLDDTLYLCSGVVKPDYSNLNKIKVFPGVKKFFSQQKGVRIADSVVNIVNILVSKGNPEIQLKKLESLGIKDYFQSIIFCDNDKDKKSCFEKVIKKTIEKYPLFEGWVIGNRIDSEIRYGKELGLKTVLIKQGKYKHLKATDAYEIPDYEIEHFSKLRDVLRLNLRLNLKLNSTVTSERY